MKTWIAVVLVLSLASVVFAQEAPDPRVAELQEANKNLLVRLQALEQRTAPTPREKAREIRAGFVANCAQRGLRFKEVHIDGASGKVTLICR